MKKNQTHQFTPSSLCGSEPLKTSAPGPSPLQEILRIMTVATGDEGASSTAAEAQGLAPSTPASSQPSDVELESGEEWLEGKTDITVDDTVTMHSFIL